MGDFRGDADLASIVAASGLDVFAHNIEVVRRLSPTIRDRRASYAQSLKILAEIKQRFPTLKTKSSLMVGFGETEPEVYATLDDLRAVGVDFVSIGQYVRPTKGHAPVAEYVSPASFESFRRYALTVGFSGAASGPLVRSSYRAGELFISAQGSVPPATNSS